MVHQFAATSDAQKVWQNLLEQYEGGTAAQLEEETLEDNLKTYKLDSTWNKPIEVFLINWSHRLMDLEECSDRNLPEDDKSRILTAAICHHDELNKAISSANLMEQTMRRAATTTSPTRMTFTQFYQFVMDQALVIDRNWKEKNAGNLRRTNKLQQNNSKGSSSCKANNSQQSSSSKSNESYTAEELKGWKFKKIPFKKWSK